MAYRIAAADGLWSAAASWQTADANSVLDSESSFTNLTTGTLDSATFVPAAVAIDAVLVKLASRAAGTPSNTISIILRNSTTATNIATVTVNVSDLKTCDTTLREGGWYCFKLGATHTPNGADSYLIRATLNSTSTAVALWTNGVANNWSRMCRVTTTGAPAAADRMIIAKEMTAAATATTRTITFDNTAATVYGSSTGISTTRWDCAAVSICNGGTLTWQTTAATNYLLTIVGSIVAFSGATWKIGDSGAEIPSDSTAVIEFQPAAEQDSRPASLGDATTRMYGQPRTVGKDVVWCLLNADAAAAATTLNVDTDTGWKNGDTIAIATTTRTTSESESRTLNANAGASSMTISAGLTNAHKGTQSCQAEVILITRNIQFRSNNTSRRYGGLETTTLANVVCSWVRFSNTGANANNSNFGVTTGTGITYQYVSFDEWGDTGRAAISFQSTSCNNFTINHCTFYTTTGTAGSAINGVGFTSSNWTINDCVSVRNNQTTGFNFTSVLGTITNIRAAGSASLGVQFSSSGAVGFGTVNNIVAHGNTSQGIFIGFSVPFGCNAHTFTTWRNGSTGIQLSFDNAQVHGGRVDTWTAFGNGGTDNITANFPGFLTGKNWVVAGDTSFSTSEGLSFTSGSGVTMKLRLENPTFGAGGGTKTTHTTRDIFFGNNSSFSCVLQLELINPTLASATEYTVGSTTPVAGASYISIQRPDGALAGSKTEYIRMGTVAYETSTVQASTASQKLTPTISIVATATAYLRSGAKRVAVASGQTVTMSVYARKDGSYNGSIEPRLVVLANAAMGITSDTVLDTLSVGANTWEQLSGTTAAVSDNGVLEFVVECNGTAGNAFCDTWAAS
jgi:hypothetical protein